MHMPQSPPTEIQIIDLSDFSARQDTILRQIRLACETVGLFYIQNHGIPDEVLQHCLNLAAHFFDLGDDSKLRVRSATPGLRHIFFFDFGGRQLYQEDPITINLGYRPSLDCQVDRDGGGDLMEGLFLEYEDPDGQPEASRNKWPAEIPELRDAVLHYYTHAMTLGQLIYRALSLAMALGEDFFEDKTKSGLSRMRLLRYPKQRREIMSAGAHRECTFTILLQQPGIEALQVAIPDQGWTFLPPIPGTLLVNLGDQTAICTNDVFRSPLHRVVSRPGSHRHSIPIFFLADFDVVLEPAENFVSRDWPRRYRPMTAGEHLAQRVAGTRA
ncbi:hypothetical protein C8R43DRAFT_1240235 [Mycena crocata]|nr:hypothetical protein C8R43DRAFT_1240235 [Mycena crocata]